jgi:lipopolysaccharide transport system ATP-binding protein
MSMPVIQIENLGKKYLLAHQRQDKYLTLREVIARQTKLGIKRLVNPAGVDKQKQQEFWALKQINFDIYPGDRVGIIGRNGAGKSTLLKILSRITEPTTGRIKLRGRVASLLEVGTGFHPELTGRENIFLNGSILGMSKAEIRRKFAEIVDFAEVEQFLDTPVKRYSSGMYVRLAFAIAAHVEPELLIVDEVLAVGDSAFQRKCLQKMDAAGKSGQTILFVSHNLSIVQNLCSRGIFLQQGKIMTDAPINLALRDYLQSIEPTNELNLLAREDRTGQGQAKLARVEIFDRARATSVLSTGCTAQFMFEVTSLLPRLACLFTIYDQLGTAIVSFNSEHYSSEDLTDTKIGAKFICVIEQLPLVPGQYHLNVLLKTDGLVQDHLEGATWFDVEPGTMQGRPVKLNNNFSKVCLPHIWTLPT